MNELLLKRQIARLEKSLKCAVHETQMYKDLLAEMRTHLKMVNHFLEYTPDKDKELQNIIWDKK